MEPPREKALVPPLQFGLVGEGIYRGGYLKPISAPFIDKLKLKTIVSITPEPVDLSFISEDIRRIHITGGSTDQGKSKKKRGVPVTDELVCQILAIIESPQNWPVYVHCINGQQVTSLVIACLRMKQQWSLTSAFVEYSRFIDYDRKEVAFVEWFDQQHCRKDSPLPQ